MTTTESEPPLDLDALAALEADARAGDWTVYETMQAVTVIVGPNGLLRQDVICGPTYERANAHFIVALRNAAPALIAAARRAQEADEDADAIGAIYRDLLREKRSAVAERDAAQAALDAAVVTARNRLDEVHRLRAELERSTR